MFNRALAFWEASRSTTTTSSDRDREMLQNSVRVVTLLGKAKMIPSILASTCEIYQFVSPYELFLLLNAIWGFLHCNPVTQAGIQKSFWIGGALEPIQSYSMSQYSELVILKTLSGTD